MDKPSDAHIRGRLAYCNGRGSDENPYPRTQDTYTQELRKKWYTGWYDERRWQRWGPDPGETVHKLSVSPVKPTTNQ